MANRFDKPQQQEYVSQYVPMPLDYLSGLAKDYTTQYKKAEEDVYALGDLMGKVKAIDEHQPYKKELEAQFKPRIESLADQFVKGTDLATASREINKLKRDWVNNPLRQELETSYAEKTVDKENARKLGVKYQDWLDPNSKFKGSTETGELVPYRANVIPEALDIEKRFSEAMKGIKEDTKGWDIEGIDETGVKIGKKGLQAGITPDKVMNIAKYKVKGILDGTLEGNQFKQKLKYYYPNATDEQIENEAIKQMFSSGSEQIFGKTESGRSMDITGAWKTLRDEESVKKGSVGQVVPGDKIHNLTENLSENLKGIVNINDQGEVKVDYTPGMFSSQYKVTDKNGKVSYHNSSEEAHKAAGVSGSIEQYKKRRLSDTDHEELASFVINAAKSIGWKDPVSTKDYDKILTEYNKASKSISYDYKLPAVEQAVIKDDMLKDRRNYKFMDEKGNIIDPVALDNSFSPDTRIYDDGKSKISFSYIDKSDPEKPVVKTGLAENLAYEDSKFHNTVAELQKDQLSFYKSGKVEDPLAEKLNTEYGFNKSNYNGPKIISAKLSPTGQSTFIVLGDPNNRKEQVYQELRNENGKLVRYNIPNLPGMMKLINADWYNTPEGQSEATRIASKQQQYESIQNNQ